MCDWDLIVLAIRFAVSSNFNIYLLFVANFQSYLEPSVHIFGSDKTYFRSAGLNVSLLIVACLYAYYITSIYQLILLHQKYVENFRLQICKTIYDNFVKLFQ